MLQGSAAEMEGLEQGLEEEEEMQFDDEDDEGIEEDLDEDGSLGLDRLQVHTVELGEAAGGDQEAAPPARCVLPPLGMRCHCCGQ